MNIILFEEIGKEIRSYLILNIKECFNIIHKPILQDVELETIWSE